MKAKEFYAYKVDTIFRDLDVAYNSAEHSLRGEIWQIRDMVQQALNDTTHALVVPQEAMVNRERFGMSGVGAANNLEVLKGITRKKATSQLIGAAQDWLLQVIGHRSELIPEATPDKNVPASETYIVLNENGRRNVDYSDLAL